MIHEPLAWLQDWFGRRGPLPTEPGYLQENYFELGLLQSLDVIELIGDMEDAFSIRFEDVHFQDRRFSTLRGLADMVGELIQLRA